MTVPRFLVGLHLEGRRAVVVGSSPEAARRARSLIAAGARVLVVCPASPCEDVEGLGATADVALRAPRDADLDDAWIAVLTDRDPVLAERLAAACEARRVFFCAVDQPEWGSFSHVATARAGSLRVGISTDGKAPALARRLREEFERVLAEANAAALVERLGELRSATPPERRAEVLNAAVAAIRFEGKLQVEDD